MELESLTTDEWELSVRRSLRPLFGRLDPFAPAIAPSVEARALLFPTDRRLSATEASAVLEAAEAIGETRVCLTLTEAHQPMGGNFDRGPHLLFDLSAYSEAVDGSPVAVLENALYSVEGGARVRGRVSARGRRERSGQAERESEARLWDAASG